MNDYKLYKEARGKAWEVIINLKIGELPIPITRICKEMGIEVKKKKMESSGLTTILPNGRKIILINEQEARQRQRFTCAHELGHIILEHTMKKGHVFRDPKAEETNSQERAANIFAARLLAPAIVLKEIGATTAEKIAKTCDISEEAAKYRAQRLELLLKREKEFIKTRGYSCFETSFLERQIKIQFREYIETIKQLK